MKKKVLENLGNKRLRLAVFRSERHIFVELIDDAEKKTLAAASDVGKEMEKEFKGLKKMDSAFKVGQLIAEKAQKIQVKKVFFDRGGFLYHGRIKALAEGARQAGLEF